MSDNVWLNAARSKVVDATAPGKKWQMPRAEAVRLGLLAEEKAPQQRRAPAFDAASAKVAPQPKRRAPARRKKG